MKSAVSVFFTSLFLIFSLLACSAPGGQGADSRGPEILESDPNMAQEKPDIPGPITILTYDSFVSEWGPGPALVEAFTKATGLSVNFVSVGDGGQVLNSLLMSGAKSDIDIVLGLDNIQFPQVLSSGLLQAYKPTNWDRIPQAIQFDSAGTMVPYDYGYFAIVYDSSVVTQAPKSLEDLTDKRFAKELILMDPRTSTPGLGFLMWTKSVYGDGWLDYWKRLEASLVTISSGWSEGYGLFTSGEGSLVLSYTTSPAYHLEYESTERYKAAIFDQGHILQVEGAGILASSQRKQGARRFMDFLLSDEGQQLLPLTNIMYPATDIPLPGSFSIAPKPKTTLVPSRNELSPDTMKATLEAWLESQVN